MSEGLAERGVAVGSRVAGAVECLIGGAVRRPAEDALAVRRRELRVDVDRCQCKASHRHAPNVSAPATYHRRSKKQVSDVTLT